MMLQKIKVNSFQKRFDSRWRNFIFNWNQGNIIKYYLNRYQWNMYPKMGKVSAFPLHVDIETTAKCNLRCGMCPSRELSKEKYGEYGNMKMELFRKLVDECTENKVFSIRLSWRGEVLINHDLVKFVHYAKVVKKIPNVSFLTNGSLLKGELAEKLIDYGVDYISVSIDGMDGMYEKIRYPLKFRSICENLKNFKELKRKKGKKKPVIRVTTLWPAIAQDPEAFYTRMSSICDKIVYNPLKDYSITEPQKKDFICQFPWERLFVGFDGKVQPCSITTDSFVIGDTNKNSLKDIWQSTEMNDLRNVHSKIKRMDVIPCNKCSYGIDYSKLWDGRDWTKWNPEELNQLSKGNQ
ncbi:MAG: radical SAM protein [Candidatus Kuenenia stuttgartiensis]|nr:radical SAM protein [Candidatus Kuenenia stuttgartiensis]